MKYFSMEFHLLREERGAGEPGSAAPGGLVEFRVEEALLCDTRYELLAFTRRAATPRLTFRCHHRATAPLAESLERGT